MKSSKSKRYTVGYAKPPVRNRFKPGQSGNPKGRPKGSLNRIPPASEDNLMRSIITEEANRMIQIRNAQGKKETIVAKRAVMRAITVNAMKGQQRSEKLFTELVRAVEQIEQEERFEMFEFAMNYRELWEAEQARRKAGRTPTCFPIRTTSEWTRPR